MHYNNILKLIIAIIFCSYPWMSNASTTYRVNTQTLNVRSGPGTNYNVIDQVKQGDKVEAIAIVDNWTKIKYSNNKQGYVSSKYLIEENDTKGVSNPYLIIGIILIIGLIIYAATQSRKKNENQKEPDSSQPKVVITKSTKSVGIAVLLAIVIPYFGILYASVKTFLWSVLSLLAFWALAYYTIYGDNNVKPGDDGIFIVGGLGWTYIHYGISIIIAGISAHRHNKKLYKQINN